MAQFVKKANGIGVRFYIEEGGKKERIYLYEKGWTQEDAENAMVEYRQKKGLIEDKNITVAGYLNVFYDNYVEHNVGETTARRYDEFISLHIVPEIGPIKLHKLKPTELQSMYTRLITIKKLSSTTVLHIHRMLHLALKYAVMWGYLKFSPADAVKAPSQARKQVVVLSDEEMTRVLSAAKETPIYMEVYIALTTGMRLGEICALKNDSIDLTRGRYTVKQTLKRVNGELKLKEPKTSGSRRSIPFLPGTEIELKKYMTIKKENRLQAGPKYNDSGFFIQNKFGGPHQPDDVSKRFKKLIRDLGLSEELSFHSLRHSHASWLLRQGVHPKVVSERLGHSSIKITLDTYSHLLPNIQESVMQSLDSTVFNKRQKEEQPLGTF